MHRTTTAQDYHTLTVLSQRSMPESSLPVLDLSDDLPSSSWPSASISTSLVTDEWVSESNNRCSKYTRGTAAPVVREWVSKWV